MRFIMTLCFSFISLVFVTAALGSPLPPEKAFQLKATFSIAQKTFHLDWLIKPGYYLYHDRLRVQSHHDDNWQYLNITTPTGQLIQDELLGKQKIYRDTLAIKVPVHTLSNPTLRISYQGCASDGYCYPPITKIVTWNTSTDNTTVTTDQYQFTQYSSSQKQENQAKTLLDNHHPVPLIIGFFLFGILLSFTPCILPMLPILSSIIIGHTKNISTIKAFSLSVTYVISMASAFSLAGAAAGLAGNQLQNSLQSPWVIACFSAIFILLALSLLGIYSFRLPSFLQAPIANLSHRQASGSYIGTAIMGALSMLIVSPCVTPPLIGALSYIGNTGDVLFGSLALFSMGIGMGIPLIIVGSLGGKYLPKSGAWMNTIERLFGFIMLAMAIWLSERLLPGPLVLALGSILLFFISCELGTFKTASGVAQNTVKIIGFCISLYAALLLVSAYQGYHSFLQPLHLFQTHRQTQNRLSMIPIKSVSDLNHQLMLAKQNNENVMLDFYADWCSVCQKIDTQVFTNPMVIHHFKNWRLLRADITANDKLDRALMKKLTIIAPPVIVFYDHTGTELVNRRLIGDITPSDLLAN